MPGNEASTEGYGNKLGMRHIRDGKMKPEYVVITEKCADNLPPIAYRNPWTSNIANEIYEDHGSPLYSDERTKLKYTHNVIVDKHLKRTDPYYQHLKLTNIDNHIPINPYIRQRQIDDISDDNDIDIDASCWNDNVLIDKNIADDDQSDSQSKHDSDGFDWSDTEAH